MTELGASELLQLEKELALLDKLKREKSVYFFSPNKPQLEMSMSDATYRCLFGANKVGKSTWGIIEDIAYCIGFRPYLPSTHRRYKTPYEPPVKGMCFAETWDKADEVLTPHFKKWIPAGLAKERRGHGRTVGWDFTNGSEIRYATYEMSPDRMEGADKHFYHFDEPPPYSMWAPVTRGVVVQGGKVWLTLTLLSEGWIWDEIYERCEAGDPDYYAVTGDIRDNLERTNADGSITGALSEDAIRRFEKTLDDVQKEVRLHGRPQHLQGRIFKHFKVREPWVIEPWEIPEDWPTIRAIDPHLAKPIAVLWARVAPSGRIIVTDELFDPEISNMDELTKRIEEIEKKGKHNVKMSVMDSSANQKDVNGKSMIDIFSDYGIHCRPAPKADKRARLYDTAERFKVDVFTKSPGIVLFGSCDRLIWEIKRYVHPELRTKTRGERYREIPDGTNKRDDDLIDCLLYMVSQDPKYNSLRSGFGLWSPDISRGNRNATYKSTTANSFAEEYGGYRESGDSVQNCPY